MPDNDAAANRHEEFALTPLGEALEKVRIATGMSTEAFLRAHGLHRRTWDRLIYGRPSAHDLPPMDSTVLRYGRAAGLSDVTAMSLADQTFSPNPADLTALGAVMEPARRKLGESIRTFVDKRGLSYTTYRRLIRRGLYQYHATQYRKPVDRGWPPSATVRKYAHALGLSFHVAERFAAEDRATRNRPPDDRADDRADDLADAGGPRDRAGEQGDHGPSDTADPGT